jgi:hypothetical protein
MKTLCFSLLLLSAALLGGAAPLAQACDGYGYGYGAGTLYDSMVYRVPHFAAYPPVYYSAPVPRTYGYSPFAYPPNAMTPEVAREVEPQVIQNPYVPASTPKPVDEPTDRTAGRPRPQVLDNPFVASREAVARR